MNKHSAITKERTLRQLLSVLKSKKQKQCLKVEMVNNEKEVQTGASS